jgi:U4/U6.U5 tri-snRNP-associated protein 1
MSKNDGEVIELSVEETNELRASLGLAPLRLSSEQQAKATVARYQNDDHDEQQRQQDGEEVLELSVDDTNALRAKLGLPPLRTSSSSQKEVIDAGLKEKQEAEERAEREEKERLQQDVEQGIASTFTAKPLGAEDSDVKSWAEKLRSQKQDDEKKGKTKKEKKSKREKKTQR